MSMADVPWPPPSAVAVRHQHDLSRSPFLRHVADLYWTAHLPEHEREQVLDYIAAYDRREPLRAEAAAIRAEQDAIRAEMATLARVRADARLLTDLADFWTDQSRQDGLHAPHIDTPTIHPPRIRPPSTWDEAA